MRVLSDTARRCSGVRHGLATSGLLSRISLRSSGLLAARDRAGEFEVAGEFSEGGIGAVRFAYCALRAAPRISGLGFGDRCCVESRKELNLYIPQL
jgi:hypothetical protein